MKRLIVNADDFGMTPGVNRGILRCHLEGIVTSATIMANGEAFDDAVELARSNPKLGVGVHLVLVGGRAVASREKIGSLSDAQEELPRSLSSLFSRWHRGAIRREQIENEMRAQIEKVLQAGITPTHLDTHKHTHCHPWVMAAVAQVAGEYGISRVRMPFDDVKCALHGARQNHGVRMGRRVIMLGARVFSPAFRRFTRRNHLKTPDHFYGFGVTGNLGRDVILQIMKDMPEGTSELVCHPGICDADLRRQPTRLLGHREQEMAALLDPLVRKEIVEKEVRLISYRELN